LFAGCGGGASEEPEDGPTAAVPPASPALTARAAVVPARPAHQTPPKKAAMGWS
jgi:hypothetical protein